MRELERAVERVRAYLDVRDAAPKRPVVLGGLRATVIEEREGKVLFSDDLRLILSALTAPPVTEEGVEAGARAMCSHKGYPPDEIFHAQGETPMRMWQFFKEDARVVLAAAGGGK